MTTALRFCGPQVGNLHYLKHFGISGRHSSRELNSAQEEARRAQADVDENERWASRALPAEVHNSRAGVERSREWRDQINGQIQSIQVEIENQQHDFATATERARMHTYLAREASAELTWLKFLAQRLTDPTAVAGSIDINW